MEIKRLFYLDFIRAIAILLIIFYHYNVRANIIMSHEAVLVENFLQLFGSIGVSLFFILSGASLALSSSLFFRTGNFYLKRCVAIYPLFYTTYISFFIAYLLIYRGNPFPNVNPLMFLMTVVGLDGLFASQVDNYYLIGEWFLGCIILLYAVYPLVWRIFEKNRLLLLSLTAFLLALIFYCYNLEMDVFWFPATRLFEFSVGMFIVTTYRDYSLKNNFTMFAVGGLALAVIFTGGLYEYAYVARIFLGISVFVFIAPLAGFAGNTIGKKPFRYLSRYTYGAFLFHHQFIIQYLRTIKGNINHVWQSWMYFIVGVIIIFMVSYVLTNLTTLIIKWISNGYRK